jgi:hypothetical protein
MDHTERVKDEMAASNSPAAKKAKVEDKHDVSFGRFYVR